MTNSLWVQGIGLLAVCISLSIFQINKRKNMLRLGAAAAALYTAHFYLLGAYSGAAMNLVGGVRSYVFSEIKPSKKTLWLLVLFMAMAVSATVLTWQGPISLLPFFGTTAIALAFWQNNPTNIRRLAMLAPPLWFTYNLISHSYPGMLIEIIMLTSNLVGQYRFDGKKLRSNLKPQPAPSN